MGIAAIVGALYAAFLDYFLRSDVSFSSFIRGGTRGLILASIVVVFEYGLGQSELGRTLRRAPFSVSLVLRTTATTVVLMGGIVLSRLLLSSRGHSITQWFESGFVRDFIFVAFAALLFHFALQTQRIIGGRTLIYFLLGRYNRPIVEQRIFMLIDIAGSTAIAQKLGETRAHRLVSQFFFDIAEPIRQFHGETDIYIGDEVVVSWLMSDPVQNSRCLECYRAIRETTDLNQPQYLREFGVPVEIRVGIHGGPIAAGECGDNKRQVVFIGDTLNTAKRLQEACKEYNRDVLVSGSLLEQTKLPGGITTELVGSTVLRGRDSTTEIFGLQIGVN